MNARKVRSCHMRKKASCAFNDNDQVTQISQITQKNNLNDNANLDVDENFA